MAPELKNLIQPVEGIQTPRVDTDFEKTLDTLMFQEANLQRPLTPERVEVIKANLTQHFEEVAPDLKTFGLAQDHISKLVDHAFCSGAQTEFDLLKMGAQEFYEVGKDILGPLWASYVDLVFTKSYGHTGTFVFAARDATPMYWAGQGLVTRDPKRYDITDATMVHADWNRWFMAQEDELDESGIPLTFSSNPMLKTFYEQMGFCNGNKVIIVEPGAWGSAANALKTMLPNQQFELYFMFSHMPDRIYGFLNENCKGTDSKFFELINDTAEAVPKAYIRPTKLAQHNGYVMADLSDRKIDSPYMRIWSWAVNQGALEAGLKYDPNMNIQKHVNHIVQLSQLSAQGQWTGVLPRNTLTWTEGERWIKEWPWGKIPPLK